MGSTRKLTRVKKHKLFVALIVLLLSVSNAYARGGKKISRPITTDISIDNDDEGKDRLVLNVEQDSYSYANTEYFAPMLTYSTHGWSIGLASQNIPWSGGGNGNQAQNYQNDTYFNLSKTFRYGDVLDFWDKDADDDDIDFLNRFSSTLGSQTGLVFPLSSSTQPGYVNHNTLHEFYFEDNDIEVIKDRLSVHAGPYWVNAGLSTLTSYWGYQDGVEVVILPKKLRFNFDLYSGHSNVSGRVYQATYSIDKHFELFAGYGEPASASGNHPYALMGFNLIGIFGKN